MAPGVSSVSFALLLFLLLCFYDRKVQGNDEAFEVLRLETLMPATVCTTSKVPSSNSMMVVDRHGPCFPSGNGQVDHSKILAQDSQRVAFIQNRARLANHASENKSADAIQESLISLPLRHGRVIGSDSFVVTIGLGTPKRDQTVIFDTGSDMCWVQCRPCPRCYPQREPIFDPFHSSTYRNVTYNAPECTSLKRHGRVGNTCTYRMRYADMSNTSGFLAKERLTLTPTTVMVNFVLGCGQQQSGFSGAAGLFGLGRSRYSLQAQASTQLGNIFSYCLPTTVSYTGHLTIGRSAVPSPSYTPMVANRRDPIPYYVDLIGITVGARRLTLPPSIFQRRGTVIDSGTGVTYLPPRAYRELKQAFRSSMSQYPLVSRSPGSFLDTCYDFTRVANPNVTRIMLHFSGTNLLLSSTGVLLPLTPTRTCLAFTANNRDSEVTIIGNLQQRGTEVIYDLDNRRIGFAPNQCQ